MNVLGIETSCDETSAAVVNEQGRVFSNVVYTQIARHQPYGGVVPEIASRCHVEALPDILRRAVDEAGLGWEGIDAVAATRGPGLVSSLLIGLTAARSLALRLDRPLLGVNHLEAHLYSIFLTPGAPQPADICPLVILLVSGGHTCLVRMEASGDYTLLGQTLDDAAGEALDKGAKLLGLGYPGGPVIEKSAIGGSPSAIAFPRGMKLNQPNTPIDGFDRKLCFSFSGLKTALLYYLKAHPETTTSPEQMRDVTASYQEAVFDSLLGPAEAALKKVHPRAFGCAGGVARNARLRDKLNRLAKRFHIPLLLAAPEYCTDNAAMVAALAAARAARDGFTDASLEAQPNLSLPLA
ncbi:MAG TPA: tRNA (adenosine(37)-N6)-threonylcarbamoyltransferase complex transferase subunit TsaD [Verrucomicrobia bacterium]|nr:MAG: tRNA (adenosine(37)-N6)-threonylcarbamoyltransferase complex transferase subunit TsaD [Lentisphaerae bacterium GWF2_57_35]HBA83937.1 tRNA (adenosine(37)-N6)-threonylcarbamoyltransferase complex transferase subunit TsaD [Verrucomicrobiota bacterium]